MGTRGAASASSHFWWVGRCVTGEIWDEHRPFRDEGCPGAGRKGRAAPHAGRRPAAHAWGEGVSAVRHTTAAAADHACGRQAAGYGVGTDEWERGSPECSSGTR